MAAIMIYHIRSKYTAVGNNSITKQIFIHIIKPSLRSQGNRNVLLLIHDNSIPRDVTCYWCYTNSIASLSCMKRIEMITLLHN